MLMPKKTEMEVEGFLKGGEPQVLTDLQLAARLSYLIEVAAKRKKEVENKIPSRGEKV
jgi:hypothetical protein